MKTKPEDTLAYRVKILFEALNDLHRSGAVFEIRPYTYRSLLESMEFHQCQWQQTDRTTTTMYWIFWDGHEYSWLHQTLMDQKCSIDKYLCNFDVVDRDDIRFDLDLKLIDMLMFNQ